MAMSLTAPHDLTIGVVEAQIGGSTRVGYGQAVAQIDAPARGSCAESAGHGHPRPWRSPSAPVCQGGDRFSAMLRPTPPSVTVTRPGLLSAGYQCAVRRAADIHVHRAYHCHIGALAQQVTAPADQPLAHQVGDMHRHRGTRNARPLRQFLLGDQRIIANPCKDFPVRVWSCGTSITKHIFNIHNKCLSVNAVLEQINAKDTPFSGFSTAKDELSF